MAWQVSSRLLENCDPIWKLTDRHPTNAKFPYLAEAEPSLARSIIFLLFRINALCSYLLCFLLDEFISGQRISAVDSSDAFFHLIAVPCCADVQNRITYNDTSDRSNKKPIVHVRCS